MLRGKEVHLTLKGRGRSTGKKGSKRKLCSSAGCTEQERKAV
jgi:hypothetical protein